VLSGQLQEQEKNGCCGICASLELYLPCVFEFYDETVTRSMSNLESRSKQHACQAAHLAISFSHRRLHVDRKWWVHQAKTTMRIRMRWQSCRRSFFCPGLELCGHAARAIWAPAGTRKKMAVAAFAPRSRFINHMFQIFIRS
jgi:hypothetical protein